MNKKNPAVFFLFTSRKTIVNITNRYKRGSGDISKEMNSRIGSGFIGYSVKLITPSVSMSLSKGLIPERALERIALLLPLVAAATWIGVRRRRQHLQRNRVIQIDFAYSRFNIFLLCVQKNKTLQLLYNNNFPVDPQIAFT